MRTLSILLASIFGTLLFATWAFWLSLYFQGKRFALRDKLKKSDAIIVLAGTRGNIAFLHGKIATAVKLYQQGWAPSIIGCGKFSAKVTDSPKLIPTEALQQAVAQGRIQEKDVPVAKETWDTGLGATYIREQAERMGVPAQALLVEQESLHTRENAEYVLSLLKRHQMQRVVLVTSPFHQLRTYLTFKKVFQPHGIEIVNYYAEADNWNPLTWFLSAKQRLLVKSERERIKIYRAKGDLL